MGAMSYTAHDIRLPIAWYYIVVEHLYHVHAKSS